MCVCVRESERVLVSCLVVWLCVQLRLFRCSDRTGYGVPVMAALALLLRLRSAARSHPLQKQAARWITRDGHHGHLNNIDGLPAGSTKFGVKGFQTFSSCGVKSNGSGSLPHTVGIARNEILRRFQLTVNAAVCSRGTASAAVAWTGKKGLIGRVSNGGLGKEVGERLSLLASIKSAVQCYSELSKVRLSMLVVMTAGLGFVMGSGEVVDWAGLAWMSAGTMMTSCSANAFNQIMEIANDARMKRTMRRPLPSGRMGVLHATAFAVTAGVGGVMLLAYKTNALTTELGAGNLLLYTLVYTPLKQIHWVNTWVGAVVGAIPPLMGWAAAAGQIDAGGWILGATLYFWQIPHFMALAFLCRRDYAAGRYKMLSLGDMSGRRTALAALRNCIYLVPLGFLAKELDVASGYFGLEMMLLSAGLGATATSFYFSPNAIAARTLFRASLLYLVVLSTAMIYQRIPNPNSLADSKLEAETTEGNSTAHGPLVYVNLEGVRKNEKPDWSYWPVRPPIAALSAAPFPFLPAPEDRDFQQS